MNGSFTIARVPRGRLPKGATTIWPGGVQRWDTCSTTPRSGRPAKPYPLETWGAIALLDVFNLITLFPIVVQTFSEAVETFIGSRTYKPTKSQQVFSWSRFCEVRSSNATHLLLTICLVGLAWLCHMGVIMFQQSPFHYQNIWSWLLTQEQRLTSIATCYAMDKSSLLAGTLIDPISPHAGKNFGIFDRTFWFWTTVSHCHAVLKERVARMYVTKDTRLSTSRSHSTIPYNPNIATSIS